MKAGSGWQYLTPGLNNWDNVWKPGFGWEKIGEKARNWGLGAEKNACCVISRSLWRFDNSKILRSNWVHNDSKCIPDSREAICKFVATKQTP